MKLVIRKIILYPKDREKKPRVVEFAEDKVNVITGYSQKGKSAIIHIIDYCLGSKDCHIPLGTIRDKVDKFAIEIRLDGMLMFIARDNPNDPKTNIYYEIYSDEKNRTFRFDNWITDADKFKTNREDLKNNLGKLAGFENISEKGDKTLSGFDAPASFRDTAAFLFQPQSIIANPTTIFYKTDTFEHLARLKTLFPLVLGYKSYDILRLEKKIEGIGKELSDKQRKLDEIKAQYENWQSDIYQYYSRAIALGLTNSDINIARSTVDALKDELTKIVGTIQSKNYLKEGSAFRYTEKLEELEIQRQALMRQLDDTKIELRKIEQFDRNKEIYISQVSKEIANRLSPIDWFIEQKGTNICPFCDSHSDKAINELLNLKEIQVQNAVVLDERVSKEFSFEKEKAAFRNTIAETERTVKNIDTNIKILEDENREYYDRYQNIFEFSGKIETVLENLEKISPSGELAIEIEKSKIDLATERANLKKMQEKFDKQSCLEKVTGSIDNYIKILPIEERESHKVRLDPDKSVSIRVENTRTREIVFLSRIGSGANHMGYHIATMLGLHEYFHKLPLSGKLNYIPSFLVLDQPSQVYFPKFFPGTGEGNEKPKAGDDEDIKNTTAIFSACSTFMQRTDFAIQIIILEHAPESTWKDVDNIHMVEEWRSADVEGKIVFNALIQPDWFE